jgi:hypothetical protein
MMMMIGKGSASRIPAAKKRNVPQGEACHRSHKVSKRSGLLHGNVHTADPLPVQNTFDFTEEILITLVVVPRGRSSPFLCSIGVAVDASLRTAIRSYCCGDCMMIVRSGCVPCLVLAATAATGHFFILFLLVIVVPPSTTPTTSSSTTSMMHWPMYGEEGGGGSGTAAVLTRAGDHRRTTMRRGRCTLLVLVATKIIFFLFLPAHQQTLSHLGFEIHSVSFLGKPKDVPKLPSQPLDDFPHMLHRPRVDILHAGVQLVHFRVELPREEFEILQVSLRGRGELLVQRRPLCTRAACAAMTNGCGERN